MERESVAIVSKRIYGPRFGLGMLGLVALFSFGLGVASGGIILPFLRSAAPASIGSSAVSSAKGPADQAMLSILPQSILAELSPVQGPIATNLSIEQYLNDIEVRASQAGFISSRSFQTAQSGFEIGFVFKAGNSVKAGTPKMPETLALRFRPGPHSGTFVLTEMRRDGVPQSPGKRFVDLVRAGASLPVLPESQALTSRGLIEIKTIEGGSAAYLDGVLIYPGQSNAKGQGDLLAPETGRSVPAKQIETGGWPEQLSIQAVWPDAGALPELAVLVAHDETPRPCSGRVIILDLRRGTKITLTERLQEASLRTEVRERGLALSGFCSPVTRRRVVEDGSEPEAAQPIVFYDMKAGQVRMEAEIDAESSSPPETRLWRQPSDNRIASPLGQKGALASVACRVGGGYTIAVSGLPAPKVGTSSPVRVSGGGKAVTQAMTWKPSAKGYELDGRAESVAADPVLARLSSGQSLEFSTNGASIILPAPQPAQLAGLVAKCQKPKPTPQLE